MKAILDIESKAQGIMNTLGDIRAENEKNTEEELKKLKEKAQAETAAKIADYTAELEAKSAQDMAELERSMKERGAALEKTFNDNKSRWVKEITDAIVKDDTL